MYSYEISEKLRRTLKKLYKKNKKVYEAILKKVDEVINSNNPDHYKNLSYDLKEYKRIHIRSFVLVFKIDKKNRIIRFQDFQHHDDIYKR